jgi:hypothetical protein
MAKCEGRVHLPQCKIHLTRRSVRRIESGLLAYDSNDIAVACEETRTRLAKKSSLGATRQNPQFLAWCLQRQASQGKSDLRDACDPLNSIDCKHLRRNGVNASTQGREQKIRVSICYLSISRRSPRRRRKTNAPPSGRRIVQNALFRQRGVRMSSTQGRHLLSASPEDIAVDHGPAANLAAP